MSLLDFDPSQFRRWVEDLRPWLENVKEYLEMLYSQEVHFQSQWGREPGVTTLQVWKGTFEIPRGDQLLRDIFYREDFDHFYLTQATLKFKCSSSDVSTEIFEMKGSFPRAIILRDGKKFLLRMELVQRWWFSVPDDPVLTWIRENAFWPAFPTHYWGREVEEQFPDYPIPLLESPNLYIEGRQDLFWGSRLASNGKNPLWVWAPLWEPLSVGSKIYTWFLMVLWMERL